MSRHPLTIRSLTPAIGAEVQHFDLSGAIDEARFKQIYDALMEHCVIFFRSQKITPAELRDFAARFGELNIHPYLQKVQGIPELVLLENDRDRPPAVNMWHTDLTYLEKPPMGAVLYAHVVPPVGGDTVWMSLYAAYDALSESVRRFLDGLTAVHEVDYEDYAKALGNKVKLENAGRRSAEHPAVRTHPVTGRKCLFVNAGSTKCFKELSRRESDALLNMLLRHLETPEFQVRLRWDEGTVAIWDNRCTQHYGVADYWPQRRVMYRAAIEGDKPFR